MKPAGFDLRTVSTLFASLTLFASKAAWLLATNNENNENRVKMKKGREYKLAEVGTRQGLSGSLFLSAKKTLKTFSKPPGFPVLIVRNQQPRGFEREQSPCSQIYPVRKFSSRKSTKSGFLAATKATTWLLEGRA
jgi:hypothetical protein